MAGKKSVRRVSRKSTRRSPVKKSTRRRSPRKSAKKSVRRRVPRKSARRVNRFAMIRMPHMPRMPRRFGFAQKTATAQLRVRAQPCSSSPPLAYEPTKDGAVVEVVDTKRDVEFSKIKYQTSSGETVEGWVKSDYLGPVIRAPAMAVFTEPLNIYRPAGQMIEFRERKPDGPNVETSTRFRVPEINLIGDCENGFRRAEYIDGEHEVRRAYVKMDDC